MKELEGLDRWLEYHPDGVWKWYDGKEKLRHNAWRYLPNGIGDVFAVKEAKHKNLWSLMRLPACDLKYHTCEQCGRRGRRGFISDCYVEENMEIGLMCFGCRRKYASMRKKIEQCRKLGIEVRRNLRNLKGITDEASKNNARTA